MNDQAFALRGLTERRAQAVAREWAASGEGGRCQTIALAGGKGGVGKSQIALNLAIALAGAGRSVVLLDVSFGVGSLELLAGVNGQFGFSHAVSGAKQIHEVLVEIHPGVQLLSGVGRLTQVESPTTQNEAFELIWQLKIQADYLLVDLGAGMEHILPRFLETADRVICVTTAEPASIAETYAVIKSFAGSKTAAAWDVLFSQTQSARDAEKLYQRLRQTTRVFLKTKLAWAGVVPWDEQVPKAVAERVPFLVGSTFCKASDAIRRLSIQLVHQAENSHPTIAGSQISLERRPHRSKSHASDRKTLPVLPEIQNESIAEVILNMQDKS
jgi:flagellar biosynthesis protein FlhG